MQQLDADGPDSVATFRSTVNINQSSLSNVCLLFGTQSQQNTSGSFEKSMETCWLLINFMS